jgi:hypothetical protein
MNESSEVSAVLQELVDHFGFILSGGRVELRRPAFQRRGAAQLDGHQPRAGVAWNAVDHPTFQRNYQRILQDVLRQRVIPKPADGVETPGRVEAGRFGERATGGPPAQAPGECQAAQTHLRLGRTV